MGRSVVMQTLTVSIFYYHNMSKTNQNTFGMKVHDMFQELQASQ